MDWNRPNGPCTLGPGRCCSLPMTRRSNHTANSTDTSRNTRTITALMITIQIESPLSAASATHLACSSVGVAVASVMPHIFCTALRTWTGAAGVGLGLGAVTDESIASRLTRTPPSR